jgi:hypothetical protein
MDMSTSSINNANDLDVIPKDPINTAHTSLRVAKVNNLYK